MLICLYGRPISFVILDNRQYKPNDFTENIMERITLHFAAPARCRNSIDDLDMEQMGNVTFVIINFW